MPYYPTLAEDVARAKEILAKGKDHDPLTIKLLDGGAIYGGDIYAAYKLLESFVQVIEAVDPKVCELVMRREAQYPRLKHTPGCTCVIVNGAYRSTSTSGCPIHNECVCRRVDCGHPASEHDGHGGCKLCQRLDCWT